MKMLLVSRGYVGEMWFACSSFGSRRCFERVPVEAWPGASEYAYVGCKLMKASVSQETFAKTIDIARACACCTSLIKPQVTILFCSTQSTGVRLSPDWFVSSN